MPKKTAGRNAAPTSRPGPQSSAGRVFISFSGDRSQAVAVALASFLPDVIQAVRPFLSAHIQAGARWLQGINVALEACHFGIACLTSDNLSAPWIHYEAGALSKNLDVSRVVPYLLDVEKAQVEEPLSQFQMKLANEAETLEMLQALNTTVAEPLDDDRLRRAFAREWPAFKGKLDEVPAVEEPVAKRDQEDILAEVLRSVRSQDQRLARIESAAIGERTREDQARALRSSVSAEDQARAFGGFSGVSAATQARALESMGGFDMADMGKGRTLGDLIREAVEAERLPRPGAMNTPLHLGSIPGGAKLYSPTVKKAKR